MAKYSENSKFFKLNLNDRRLVREIHAKKTLQCRKKDDEGLSFENGRILYAKWGDMNDDLGFQLVTLCHSLGVVIHVVHKQGGNDITHKMIVILIRFNFRINMQICCNISFFILSSPPNQQREHEYISCRWKRGRKL